MLCVFMIYQPPQQHITNSEYLSVVVQLVCNELSFLLKVLVICISYVILFATNIFIEVTNYDA
jgi:hypothetical protein